MQAWTSPEVQKYKRAKKQPLQHKEMQFMFSDQPALLERRQGSREHESTGCEASDMPLFALGRAQTAHSYGALTKLFCVRSGINPVSGTFSSLTWRKGDAN